MTPKGEQVRLSVLHGAEQSTVRLDAGQRGTSALSTVNDARLVAFADSLRQGMSPSWKVAIDAAQQLPRSVENYDLWNWLKGIDISPTILVIPGVSALRSKIPAVDLGPVTLPECLASVSARTIAIDLHHGTMAATLTIDDARFDGNATIAIGEGLRAVIANARLVLTLDFTYSYSDGRGSLWLQSLVGVCGSGRIEPAILGAKPVVTIESGPIRLSATNVWYSFDSKESHAESGEIRLECSNVRVKAHELALGEQVSIVGPHLAVEQATIRSQLRGADSAAGLAVDARLSGVSASFDQLKLASSADFSVDGIAAGPGGALRADNMLVDLTSGDVREMSAGVSVAYGKAAYRKAGVSIDVQASDKNLLVLSAARDSLTDQYGFRAKVASATIIEQELGVSVPLKNLSLNHHRIEHQPRVPITHRTKTVTAVSDIAFLITGFGATVIPAGRVYVGWPVLPQILNVLGRLASVGVDEALSWLGKAIGAPLDFLGDVIGIITLGQVRVEDVTPFVEALPVRLKFEPEWSSDQTLTFKVVGGIHGVGIRLAYSYPCPELTDWGKRCDDSQEPWTEIPRIELELGLAVTLDVDPAAKRIRVQKIVPFIPNDVDPSLKPIFEQLQDVALTIVAAIYGMGWIQSAVTAAINAAIPMKLPDQWDVSRLTVSRDAIDIGGDKVWGVELALRFEEHLFA
ncbi:MAG: hypothetical protein EOP84_07225 [Verrucomicrobiaceae bacterium]|nr:MAG: hypothetical protein EOP84_07225 [Verrucomicrobiaceae bacterium]